MAMLGKRRSPRPATRKPSSTRPTPPAADEGVTILRLAHDGRGVARDAAGKTLFVDRALPGERVEVAVHKSRQRFDEAHVREVLKAAPERVTPTCPHFGVCGGCDLQHQTLEAQRNHKQQVLVEQLARQGLELEQSPDLLAGEGLGYRRRARLGVKVDAEGSIHLGFRARGSHHLIDMTACPVLVPALEALLSPLRERLATLDAPRQVGHLELIASDAGVCLVVRQLRDQPADAKHWNAFAAAHGLSLGWLVGRETPRLEWLTEAPDLHYGLTLSDSGQAPGQEPEQEKTRELVLGFAPGDFLQVNAEVNQCLVDTALAWLAPQAGERVLDCFAGVGNFSLALAARTGEVTGVEGSPRMVERLAANARRNGFAGITARQADLSREDQARALLAETEWDLVVLDPPREGAEALSRRLATSRVSRILYVSCDPATLARDAAHLVAGGYRLKRAAVADMFAQTAHLEAVLLFEHPEFPASAATPAQMPKE
ncbi:23S rRNA (uracil(1939)-C(5))-methyltransferase RlmD [Halomonas sp. YLGW01]|uniref:23S rRNA (uracil(1939)-C(5))-methyltransferase RlmD n=1 Tax=Halomonas sp. YLGW01 TaxID=2773308 RepID=UPI00177F2D16|nr:23S rRNA (uracil(1939)-C(5))-methyltransferase RlmD [Halomonas sp. YLGW01]